MPIYKAISKYGYANFRLEILEYCLTDIIIEREQYYLNLLKPEYNILDSAGSSKGYKHTAETLDKFKTRFFSDEALANLALAATGRILDEETKEKISKARTGMQHTSETKDKLSKITTERIGVGVIVENRITGEILEYETLTLASIALNVSRTAVSNAVKSGQPINKTYIVKRKK
jgi:group I intron endonuclease